MINRRGFIAWAGLGLFPFKVFGFLGANKQKPKKKSNRSDFIYFTILSADNCHKKAIVRVDKPKYNGLYIYNRKLNDAEVRKLYELCHNGSFIILPLKEELVVFDRAGCFLNEPEVDLIGRKGCALFYKGKWIITLLGCLIESSDHHIQKTQRILFERRIFPASIGNNK